MKTWPFQPTLMSKQFSPLWDKAGMPPHVNSSQWLFGVKKKSGENKEQKNPHMLLCWKNMSKMPNTSKFPKDFHACLIHTFSMRRYMYVYSLCTVYMCIKGSMYAYNIEKSQKINIYKNECAGLGWDKVNVLHSS